MAIHREEAQQACNILILWCRQNDDYADFEDDIRQIEEALDADEKDETQV